MEQSFDYSHIEKFEPSNEIECIEKYRNSSFKGDLLCPPSWDTFFCWPPTSAGSIVSFPCASIFPFLNQSFKKGIAFRICDEKGLWSLNWTNYSECQDLLPEAKVDDISPLPVIYIFFFGSTISLVSLGITFFIFSYFKTLQCSRVRVHQNLVLSLILHSFLMMIISLSGLFEEVQITFQEANWFCKTVLVLKMYSAMTCIHWMFVEGLLLHSSITVSVFQHEPPFKLYYAIGWGVPLICVVIWVVMMTKHLHTSCWKGYGHSPFIWFITGPMIFALTINAIFLVNIIRILVIKMKTSSSVETKQVKKAVKATALLFPLLGITHLLFCINPRDNADFEHAYMITNAVFQSSQGLFVAVLYCFLNSEVQAVLSAAYKRATLRHVPTRSCRGSRGSRALASTTTISVSPEVPNGAPNRGRFALHKASLVVSLKRLSEPAVESSTTAQEVNQNLLEKETSFLK